ncbi:hypothetical protein N7463_002866 [Penicillium fimorum]|uniref:Uncharacterized protein n=1 Tax=Penicillium fimorum TaxID=1882269 RepID=A0A9W9Y1H8_9EURO|nr:hypothetical protein N7463_002866 [Penicillium fimorum]
MAAPPEQQPLVKGGHARILERLPSMFVCSTVPSVYDNTIIVAATHPTLATAGPSDDGWFISDFYAFNYLFKGLGMEQTWLTAADPEKLIQKYGHYLHGNPYEQRKICLDRELLDQGRLTPVTVVRPADMIDRFLVEVKRASELAKRKEAPLLLLVLCHGLPNHHLLLNDSNGQNGLSIVSLKGVLEPGVHVSLVTTACYSGGWITTPDLNHTTMAAADGEDDLFTGTSNAWSISQSIGRSCGSVFASTLFQTLSSAASPLLELGMDSTPSDLEQTLQPDSPSQRQTLTYNAFCDSVWRICENRVTRLWSFQNFRFSAQDDAWEFSWTGRTGIPLTHFENRWNLLTSYPYSGPSDIRALRNPDPKNFAFSTQDLNKTAAGQGIIDEMTDHIAHRRLKEMARTFHTTCPGDWDRGKEVGFGGTLRALYERDEYQERAPIFESTIRFRWEAALLADYIIELFELPVPSKEICIMWNRIWWIECNRRTMPDLQARWKKMYNSLSGHFMTPCFSEQGPPFYRPLHYLVAAFIEADKPDGEASAVISTIGEFMSTVRTFHQQRLCKDREVRSRGRAWLRTIGRRARESLSPRKRISREASPSC